MTIRPIRLQLSRAKGFSLQALTMATNGLPAVKVDRTTKYGNPWRVGQPMDMVLARKWGFNISPAGRAHVCIDAAEAAKRFLHAIIWDGAIHESLRQELGGKNPACWCGLSDPCHGNALLLVANSTPEEIDRLHYMIDQRIMAEAEIVMRRSLQ